MLNWLLTSPQAQMGRSRRIGIDSSYDIIHLHFTLILSFSTPNRLSMLPALWVLHQIQNLLSHDSHPYPHCPPPDLLSLSLLLRQDIPKNLFQNPHQKTSQTPQSYLGHSGNHRKSIRKLLHLHLGNRTRTESNHTQMLW